MGQRGPKPTPTATLRLRGSTLVTGRREQAEVQGRRGLPIVRRGWMRWPLPSGRN